MYAPLKNLSLEDTACFAGKPRYGGTSSVVTEVPVFYPRLAVILLLTSILTLTYGCGSSEEGPDTTQDGGTDLSTVPDQGMDQDSSGCTFQNDCGASENCHEGQCIPAPECENINAWTLCVDPIAELGGDAAIRAVCRDGFCKIACIHDDECASGETCTDFGQCKPFTSEVTGIHPGGSERKPLRAGVSNVPLYFPIGISAAGYGSRRQNSTNQYAQDLYPSAGQMHQLFARAIALDNGERELLLIRLPIIFPTSHLHEQVARALQEETGRDWRDSLIISGTHSHSGPARF